MDKIVGGVIPQSFRPAVNKGIQEAMHHGELAGAPVQGVRVELVDGSYHSVDSSEMGFRTAGPMAGKAAYMQAEPVLLEPIMELEVTVPDDVVGAVNGDLNSRRGRLQGMEPLGGLTTIRAEGPRAGGRGGRSPGAGGRRGRWRGGRVSNVAPKVHHSRPAPLWITAPPC